MWLSCPTERTEDWGGAVLPGRGARAGKEQSHYGKIALKGE